VNTEIAPERPSSIFQLEDPPMENTRFSVRTGGHVFDLSYPELVDLAAKADAAINGYSDMVHTPIFLGNEFTVVVNIPGERVGQTFLFIPGTEIRGFSVNEFELELMVLALTKTISELKKYAQSTEDDAE
jgi:hypothetical protein